MGKGKNQRGAKHQTSTGQETSRSPPTRPANNSVKEKGPPTSPSEAPDNMVNTSKFSRRKLTSNWSRYDEVSSDKVTEDKAVQRLTQLVEQSALLTTQHSFQPSLDALSEASDANEDYSHAFDVNYEDLTASINIFSVQERLDLDPTFCQDPGTATVVDDRDSVVVNKDIKPYPNTGVPFAAGNREIKMEANKLLLVIQNPETMTKQKSMPQKNTADDDGGDAILAQLLADSTGVKTWTKPTMPVVTYYPQQQIPAIDNETDSLLEEILAF